jgi:hypothetical protein
MGWSVDRKALELNYGFKCDCAGCQKPVAVMMKKKEAEKDIEEKMGEKAEAEPEVNPGSLPVALGGYLR